MRWKVIVPLARLLYKVYNVANVGRLAGTGGIHLRNMMYSRYARPLNISQTV